MIELYLGNVSRRIAIYAIVTAGGKQHKVTPGQTIDIERISGEEGSEVELDRVLMVSDGDNCTIGKPTIEGARIKATIVRHDRKRKITIFKYKNKIRYRRKRGHRQDYTRLSINEIVLN
ncbi:MAG: 50S ribosomal protein L21 [Dehalococcoidia bacterium]